jgi:CheY-like chemotaxis protein
VLVLAKLGVTADVAASGPEAVEAAGRSAYQLILMDIQMPGMDGFDAAWHIRQALGEHCPPILAMTATTDPEERQACARAGMPLLAKPFTVADVERTLALHLRPAAEAPDPASGIVDVERLALIRSLDEPGGPTLLDLFEREASERIEQLTAAATQSDVPAVRRSAHSIKGLSANVGARRLLAIAERLDSSSTEESTVLHPGCAAELRLELQRFLTAARAPAA